VGEHSLAGTPHLVDDLPIAVADITAACPVRSSLRGRAIAQAVRRWLRTAADRVCVRAACGVCGGQSGTGVSFLRVLWLHMPIIHQFLHHRNHPGLAQ
jgi:hypothetical protein